MNFGSIEGTGKAGHLYRHLAATHGIWQSPVILASIIGTTCISTVAAEVRAQVNADAASPWRVEVERCPENRKRWRYRMVRKEEQRRVI